MCRLAREIPSSGHILVEYAPGTTQYFAPGMKVLIEITSDFMRTPRKKCKTHLLPRCLGCGDDNDCYRRQVVSLQLSRQRKTPHPSLQWTTNPWLVQLKSIVRIGPQLKDIPSWISTLISSNQSLTSKIKGFQVMRSWLFLMRWKGELGWSQIWRMIESIRMRYILY